MEGETLNEYEGISEIPYSRKSWRELYLADSLFLLFGGI